MAGPSRSLGLVTGMGPGTRARSDAGPPPCLPHGRPAGQRMTTPLAGEEGTPRRRGSLTVEARGILPSLWGASKTVATITTRRHGASTLANRRNGSPGKTDGHRNIGRTNPTGERFSYPRPEAYPMTQAH